MLIVPRKLEDRVVFHCIIGEETQYFLDIHGGLSIPITEMAHAAAQEGKPAYLLITRCESERDVVEYMTERDMMPVGPDGKIIGPDSVPACSVPTSKDVRAFQPTQTKSEPKAKCAYCGDTKLLLPLAGVKICGDCALIELGLKKSKDLAAAAERQDE